MLDKAQQNLEGIMKVNSEAKDLVRVLMAVADKVSNVRILQYVFTRVQEVLGLASEQAFAVVDKKRADLFSVDGVQLLNSEVFLKCLLSQVHTLLLCHNITS